MNDRYTNHIPGMGKVSGERNQNCLFLGYFKVEMPNDK